MELGSSWSLAGVDSPFLGGRSATIPALKNTIFYVGIVRYGGGGGDSTGFLSSVHWPCGGKGLRRQEGLYLLVKTRQHAWGAAVCDR